MLLHCGTLKSLREAPWMVTVISILFLLSTVLTYKSSTQSE